MSTGEIAAAMVGTLAHRGPDDEGVWESPDGSVALAQRRLAIIDLSPLGHNPMPWDGGRLWITFNGEIYNFRELRVELARAGYRFRSQTDTETILAAYDCWGIDSIERLVGMFAFALWDSTQRRLWVVRDRLGKKPLYYADANGSFCFGSELKALLANPEFPRTVDPVAVGQYLQYGYVPAPTSIYRHARKLPPAHHLLLDANGLVVARYWNPIDAPKARVAVTEAEGAAELDRLLTTAVRQRMISDVPLGGLLSGGIDSSLIVSLMQEQSASPVRTFTIRFDNPQFDEADHAAAVARHLGTAHEEETCTGQQLLSVVDRLPDMYDEPFADSSAVPTYLVSQMARQHVTVALSGDGGDELFWGYPRYRFHAIAESVDAFPATMRDAAATIAERLRTRRSMRRLAHVLRNREPDLYARFVSWWHPHEVAAMMGASEPPPPARMYAEALRAGNGLRRVERPPLLDLVSYLPDDILTKVDRASMAVGLEVRAPLLDHRVVEFALALPPHLKRRGRVTKRILRKLLYRRVPASLVERPKMGFSVPIDDWFRGPLRDRMTEYCGGTTLEDLGIDPMPTRQLWSDFLAGGAGGSNLLWQMFALMAWADASRRRNTVSPPVRSDAKIVIALSKM